MTREKEHPEFILFFTLFIYLFKKNKYIFAFFGANLDDILSKKNAIVLINS